MPIEAGPGVAAGFGARGAPAGGDLGPGSSSLAHAKSQLSPCRRYGNRRGPPRTGVWERSWTPVFLLGAQHRCASARSRLSNAAQADVTKALEKFRAAVGRVQIRRYAFEGLCCERWGSANRRGGREDRAAAVVRVVGRQGRNLPTSHTPERTVYPTDCRVRGVFPGGAARSPRRFVPRTTVATAESPSAAPPCRRRSRNSDRRAKHERRGEASTTGDRAVDHFRRGSRAARPRCVGGRALRCARGARLLERGRERRSFRGSARGKSGSF